jgi:hypothetical protein
MMGRRPDRVPSHSRKIQCQTPRCGVMGELPTSRSHHQELDSSCSRYPLSRKRFTIHRSSRFNHTYFSNERLECLHEFPTTHGTHSRGPWAVRPGIQKPSGIGQSC